MAEKEDERMGVEEDDAEDEADEDNEENRGD